VVQATEEALMADNKFEITFFFRKAGIAAMSFVPIDSFGMTIDDANQVKLDASWGDVFATIQEIEKQARQQMKLLKNLSAMKIKPINEKTPQKFFGMSWYPSSRYEKGFADLQGKQGKKSAGADGTITVQVTSGHQQSFKLTGVMVLAVRTDQRNGNQVVQFEFDKMEAGR
jgi:hypothetical protein